MRQNLPPSDKHSGSWQQNLSSLLTCLNDLDAAMRAGQWERIDELNDRLNQSLANLKATSPRNADVPKNANALREAAAQVDRLASGAVTRREQIQPLIEAFRHTPPATTDSTP